jgi:isopentenyl diphosphate isomerase/L-lactate dehydrogenase-like FMN-dependent dehydrogenase
MSAKSAVARAINIADLRQLAQRRMPKVVFDYLDGGADDEITLRENCRVFDELVFRSRQAVAFADCTLATKVVGFDLSFPVILAPVGYTRLMHPGGEVSAARIAGEFGTGYILSTISGHKLEDVRAASKGPVWYQLYLMGGRAAAELTIERARKVGFGALVLTVDTPVAGLRERDLRNGMKKLLSGSVFAKLPYVSDILAHPGWLAGFLADGGVPKLQNVVIPGKGPMAMIDVSAALARSVVTWEDLSWIRKLWTGPIIIKGILIGDDARRAVDVGASAVVVSNHGGRQLDGVSPSLRALPEIVAAVNGQIDVLMDGGIRRGTDVVKALCLGAKAVLAGRSYAYGLGAGGEAGVTRALQILKEGIERTMRLLGCSSVREMDPSYLQIPRCLEQDFKLRFESSYGKCEKSES